MADSTNQAVTPDHASGIPATGEPRGPHILVDADLDDDHVQCNDIEHAFAKLYLLLLQHLLLIRAVMIVKVHKFKKLVGAGKLWAKNIKTQIKQLHLEINPKVISPAQLVENAQQKQMPESRAYMVSNYKGLRSVFSCAQEKATKAEHIYKQLDEAEKDIVRKMKESMDINKATIGKILAAMFARSPCSHKHTREMITSITQTPPSGTCSLMQMTFCRRQRRRTRSNIQRQPRAPP
jgi:hypothetical protein